MAGTDFSHLTTDELIKGIKALDLPDYIRSKSYGIDVRETLAQMTEMTIQLGVNMGLSPDDALNWARKLQESVSQSEFDSWVATLLDGGPSIFMNTLSELQTTYPNGAAGVALVRETDPAKIYIWNGSAWADFGDYQGIEVKDGTITSNKVADGAISAGKTDFIKVSTNLLNPNNVEFGTRYTTDAVKESSSSWNLIRLDTYPNEQYTLKNAVRATIFDASGNYYITRSRLSNENDKFTFTTGNSGYITYITTPSATFDSEQINRGDELLVYEDFYQTLNKQIGLEDGFVKKHDVADKSLTEDKTTFLVKGEKGFVNLYDKSYLGVQDTYVRPASGEVSTISGRTATDFIPFPEKAGYIKKLSQIAQPTIFYDGNFNHISSDTTEAAGVVDGIAGYVGTSPDSTAYIRLTIFDNDKDSDFIYLSEKSQLYKAPTLAVGNDGNLSGKRGVAFGDSITMGATYTNEFPNYINVGFSGTRLLDNGTSTPHSQLAMVHLVDSILSGDWSVLETAASSVSTEFSDALTRLKAVDFNNIDFITIFYGANDSGTVATLSNRMGAVDSEARTTWNGAINYVIESILTSYPHIQIYLLTPMYRTTENYITEPLADAMVVQGNRWKLPVLDLHREMGLNHLTSGAVTRDGTHPNALGNKRLTEKIIGFLKTN